MSQTQILSSPWLPDSPAFLGFHPPELNWLSLELKKKQTHQAWWDLTRKFEFPDVITAAYKMESHHSQPYGFYRVLGGQRGGGFDWFIKVVTPSQALRQQQADKIAQFVSKCSESSNSLDVSTEIYVSKLLKGFSLEPSSDCILVYDYQPGRFLQPNMDDLTQLAKALAQLHLKLELFPDASQVKTLGLERHQLLKQSLQTIQNPECHTEVAQPDLPEAVKDLLLNYRPEYLDVLIENAQCIHGDLNVGNVWLTETGQLTFLDFEDSLTAWFNPLKDIVFVLERFIFTHAHADEQHIELARQFIQTYYQSHNHRLNHPEHIQQLLQALAVRALLLLIEVAKTSNNVVPCEWQKFVYLYELSNEQSAIFSQLFSQL